jgi:hypothetical protein
LALWFFIAMNIVIWIFKANFTPWQHFWAASHTHLLHRSVDQFWWLANVDYLFIIVCSKQSLCAVSLFWRTHAAWASVLRVNRRDEKQNAEQTIALFALDNEPTCVQCTELLSLRSEIRSDSFYRSKHSRRNKNVDIGNTPKPHTTTTGLKCLA